jgi:DNA-binding transcriptional ArsR family regulator
MTVESSMSHTLVTKKTDLTAVSLLFEALSNENRVSILNLLRKGPMSVGDISEALGLEQTAVSHNLKCLAFCGLATFEKAGKMRVYELNHQTVEPMLRMAGSHISKYAENLRGCSSLER